MYSLKILEFIGNIKLVPYKYEMDRFDHKSAKHTLTVSGICAIEVEFNIAGHGTITYKSLRTDYQFTNTIYMGNSLYINGKKISA